MVDLFSEKLQQAILDKSPFALLRKPNEKLVRLIVNDGSDQNSIVFHSFDSTIEKEISDANPLFIDQHRFNFDFEIDLEQSPSNEALSQSEYEEIIQETINTIQAQAIRKVVMSRRKVVDNQSYNLLKSYKNLMDQHATALVFLWMNPSKEVWMGATPELLLSKSGSQIKTVSLAATKRPEDEWTEKEIDEQQIVTDFILDCISDTENQKVIGPETVRAGKFEHLKTYISAEITEDYPLENLLANLHPTPALCGMPKQAAFEYIVEHERYDREFYSGYIGLIQGNEREYYVNLRSSQLFKDVIYIYVGGGITATSQAHKEWKETELKSSTILNALTS